MPSSYSVHVQHKYVPLHASYGEGGGTLMDWVQLHIDMNTQLITLLGYGFFRSTQIAHKLGIASLLFFDGMCGSMTTNHMHYPSTFFFNFL